MVNMMLLRVILFATTTGRLCDSEFAQFAAYAFILLVIYVIVVRNCINYANLYILLHHVTHVCT